MDKQNAVYPCDGILFSQKKNGFWNMLQHRWHILC